jgi:hypothetical protein
VSQDASVDAEGEDEEEGVQTSRGGKKQACAAAAGRGRGRPPKKAAAAAGVDSQEVTEEGSEDGVGDEDAHKGRRRGLAHLRALHEQVGRFRRCRLLLLLCLCAECWG